MKTTTTKAKSEKSKGTTRVCVAVGVSRLSLVNMQNTFNGQTVSELTVSRLMRAEQCSRLNYALLESAAVGVDSASIWIGTRGEKSVKALHSLAERAKSFAKVSFAGARRAVLTVRGFQAFAWQVEISKCGKFYRRDVRGVNVVGALDDLRAAVGAGNVIVGDVKAAAAVAAKVGFNRESFAFAGVAVAKTEEKSAKSAKKEKK